jgi:serine/threonine-protein kinase RsbW
MGQLRSAVRALAAAGLGPARIIEHLDAFVEQIEPAQWATLVCADVHLATGSVRLAAAGHPPPVLAEPGSAPCLIWEGRSGPLAFRPGPGGRDEAELTLSPQARLLLYTDGLVERRGESLDDGLGRLVEQFAGHRATPLPALVGELADVMLLGEQRRDDVCLLCLELAD